MDRSRFIKQLKKNSMKFQFINRGKKNAGALGLLVFLVLPFAGCYVDKEELLYPGSTLQADCATAAAKFTADVQPIILGKCAISGCHDASASGGVIFQSYTQISAKKDRINARAIVEKTMPASGSLSAAEMTKIKCWIDSGAPNN